MPPGRNYGDTAMADNSVLLGHLADDFTAKVRAGQMPLIDDYAQRHPEISERIRALFPTLLFLEGMAAGNPVPGDSGVATLAPGAGVMELAPGQMFNKYRIERELGRGGMGVVYEAVHLPLNKRVALKVLSVFAGQGPSHLERFLREAQTAAGLHHTNIVPVFDIGQANNMPYYAMQYIEGRGLDQLVSGGVVSGEESRTESQPLTTHDSPLTLGRPHSAEFFERVGQLGIQTADALAHAHERGVIHRDIKPSNLLLDNQGVLWITDFGLARRSHDTALTHSGALVGTPRYMSPEQAESSRHPIDHRTDIYSLGVTLYELSTCRPPFSGKTPTEVVLQIIGREPIPPRRLDPAIPRDLETIILKAMAKQPKDRYQTAAELGEDLRRWLKLEPIKARRVGPVGRTIRWCRRNPRLAVVSTTAAAIIVALSTFYYWSLLEENARTLEALHVGDKAREQATDSLARSLYDQARVLQTSSQPGRRWPMLELLKEAEKLRGRTRTKPAAKTPGNLPSREVLRQDAVTALLLGDARVTSEIETSMGMLPALSGDGWLAANTWIDATFTKSELRFFDLQAGKLLNKWEQMVTGLAMRPDGKVLVSTNAFSKDLVLPGISLWDIATRKPLSTFTWPAPMKPGRIAIDQRLSFSPNGCYLAASRADSVDSQLVLWDVGDPTKPKAMPNAAAGFAGSRNLAWSSNFVFNSAGNTLAYVSGEKSVRLWEFHAGNKPSEIALPLAISGPLAFGENDRLLALGGPITGVPAVGQGTVLLWDLSRKTEQARLNIGPGQAALALAFSPDGKRLAVGTLNGVILVFDVSLAREVMRVEPAHSLGVALLQWKADGDHLISGGLDGTTKVWELSDRAIRSSIDTGKKTVWEFAFSPDNKWLAVTDGAVKTRLLDRATAEVTHEFNATRPLFRADSRQLAVFRTDLALAWDLHSCKEVVRLEARGWANGKLLQQETPDTSWWRSAAFGGEGNLLLAGFQDGRLGIWDAATGKLLWQTPGKDHPQGFLSPDGRWLAEVPPLQHGQEPLPKPINVWELPHGRKAAELSLPVGSDWNLLADGRFSPDGRWLANSYVLPGKKAGSPDAQVGIALWKSPAAEPRLLASGPLSWPFVYTFSPDSKLLAISQRIGDKAGLVQLWDVEKGEELLRFTAQPTPVLHLSFTPDGISLASSDGRSGALHVLNLRELRARLAAIGLDW